ncbi:MAG: DUF2905 domain-containing protein [Siphonobacter sp.]
MNPLIGKWLIGLGVLLVLAGIIIYFFSDRLHWLGRLPGDIRVERENFRLYAPIMTCIVLTIVINIVLWLIRRFFQ